MRCNDMNPEEFKKYGYEIVDWIVLVEAVGPADALKYTDMAQEFGLLASRGSDFHSPTESRIDLGSLPDLPGQLTPVWQALLDRRAGVC